jgi:hypothetical protein
MGFFLLLFAVVRQFFPLIAAFFGEELANSWCHKTRKMNIISISTKISRNKEKKWYYFEWGKPANQRKASGIFTHVICKNLVQKNHNKEALALLEIKRLQLNLEHQSIGTAYIPSHKFKDNFLDYYKEYVDDNKRKGNRYQEGSLEQFKKFIRSDRISPIDISEKFCIKFRKHLLDNLTGKTPSDYFAPST